MKRYIKANTEAARWQDHLTSGVYTRLCECNSTKKDMVALTKAFYRYSPKVQQDNMTKKDCLEYMLTWVLDWNGGMWDYTQEEFDSWLAAIN